MLRLRSIFRPAVPILLVAVLLAGFRAGNDDFFAMRKNFELFGAVYEQLVSTYVTRVDPEKLMRAGMDAMLAELDPWTDFYDEADNVEAGLQQRQGVADVGLNLGRRGGRLTVLVPDEDASAYRQGIRTGDVMLEVAGQPVDSLSVPDVRTLLRGEPGTIVEVIVERAGAPAPIPFRLKRAAAQMRLVSFAETVPGPQRIALVKLDVFGPGAAEAVASAIKQLQQDGPLDGLLLDLRDNPGGLVNEAIALSQLFLPNGSPVVSTRGRSPEATRLFRSSADPLVPDLPVALLMNRFSASASEIVAGALQDHDRAVMIGEPSFGKGLVQVFRQLPYNTSMKLTLSRYYTPSGRGIRKDADGETFHTAAGRPVVEGRGIEPDLRVPIEEASELEEALLRESAFFLFADAWLARHGDEATDARVLDEFMVWLRETGFTYRTDLETAVDELADRSHGTDVDRALAQLQREAAAEREAAFSTHSQRLAHRLQSEIAARRDGHTAQFRNALPNDVFVTEGIAVLTDRARYSSLLSGE